MIVPKPLCTAQQRHHQQNRTRFWSAAVLNFVRKGRGGQAQLSLQQQKLNGCMSGPVNIHLVLSTAGELLLRVRQAGILTARQP
jgi:hypothetical protein